MQMNERTASEIEAFKHQFKDEIVRQANMLNAGDADGDIQDGFLLAHIDDGWVSYKGFAWGFVFHMDPVCLDMTFGPDWPFVGHRTMLLAEEDTDRTIWVGLEDHSMRFINAEQLAIYGLQRLAAKVHDENIVVGLPGQQIQQEEYRYRQL